MGVWSHTDIMASWGCALSAWLPLGLFHSKLSLPTAWMILWKCKYNNVFYLKCTVVSYGPQKLAQILSVSLQASTSRPLLVSSVTSPSPLFVPLSPPWDPHWPHTLPLQLTACHAFHSKVWVGVRLLIFLQFLSLLFSGIHSDPLILSLHISCNTMKWCNLAYHLGF